MWKRYQTIDMDHARVKLARAIKRWFPEQKLVAV